uniref:Uncharacterized protein n=1 Tax=Cannabis sativa TaxID=3483 RepID=A0A803QVE8_CANSA
MLSKYSLLKFTRDSLTISTISDNSNERISLGVVLAHQKRFPTEVLNALDFIRGLMFTAWAITESLLGNPLLLLLLLTTAAAIDACFHTKHVRTSLRDG